MANIMEFTRGDGITHFFYIPADSWSSGGRLFFAAKPQIDDDTTDSAALIEGDWDDTVVDEVVLNGITYKRYTCYFPPSATNSIPSESALTLDLLGEFQLVPIDGVPMTFPARDDKIDTKVYFDVKRKTTV